MSVLVLCRCPRRRPQAPAAVSNMVVVADPGRSTPLNNRGWIKASLLHEDPVCKAIIPSSSKSVIFAASQTANGHQGLSTSFRKGYWGFGTGLSKTTAVSQHRKPIRCPRHPLKPGSCCACMNIFVQSSILFPSIRDQTTSGPLRRHTSPQGPVRQKEVQHPNCDSKLLMSGFKDSVRLSDLSTS